MPDDVSATPPTDPSLASIATEKDSDQPKEGKVVLSAPEQYNVAPEKIGIPGVIQIPAPIKFDAETLTILLEKVNSKLTDLQLSVGKMDVKNNEKLQKDFHEKNIRKIKEAAAKAKKHRHHALLGKIFSWVAVALAIIAATLVAVISFGAGAPLIAMAAMAGAAIAVTMAVLNETGAMDKLVAKLTDGFSDILEDFGVPAKKAKLAGAIMAQVAIAVVVLGIQIGLTVATGGANTGELVSEFSSMAAQIAAKAAQLGARAAYVAQGAVTIASGSENVASSVYQYQAEMAQADVAENKAQLAKLEALLESEKEFLETMLETLTSSVSALANMQKTNHESHQKMIQQMTVV